MKPIIGILRGGPSPEYDVSLKTGQSVLQHLPDEHYHLKDVLIDKSGQWHVNGIRREPADILNHIDVAFNALHGAFGEDGTVQRMLDHFAVPYTGSRAYESALCMHKGHTKDILKAAGIKFPRHRTLSVGHDLRQQMEGALRELSLPLVVKPARAGSSVGISKVEHEELFADAVRKAFEYSTQVLIEEYIVGREATCGVIERFRGQHAYALLPVEIVLGKDDVFFDMEAKYSGKTKEICPGNFTRNESQQLQDMARLVHEHLNLRHYSRADFIVTENGIYFLEVNTLPGLTEASLFPKSLTAVGSSLPEFLDHTISLARA